MTLATKNNERLDLSRDDFWLFSDCYLLRYASNPSLSAVEHRRSIERQGTSPLKWESIREKQLFRFKPRKKKARTERETRNCTFLFSQFERLFSRKSSVLATSFPTLGLFSCFLIANLDVSMESMLSDFIHFLKFTEKSNNGEEQREIREAKWTQHQKCSTSSVLNEHIV